MIKKTPDELVRLKLLWAFLDNENILSAIREKQPDRDLISQEEKQCILSDSYELLVFSEKEYKKVFKACHDASIRNREMKREVKELKQKVENLKIFKK